MPLTALKPSQIRKIAANSLVGNATGAEARGTSLSVSQVRTLLGLGTTDSPTFNTLTATTSVLTPLVNNASAALTLGNSTYGVTFGGDARLATGYGLSFDGATFSSFLVKSGTASIGTRVVASTGTALSFELGATNYVGRFAQTTGNLLIGTTTDDGTSKLQVSGAAVVSGVGSLGTVSGISGWTQASRYPSLGFNDYYNGVYSAGATGYGAMWQHDIQTGETVFYHSPSATAGAARSHSPVITITGQSLTTTFNGPAAFASTCTIGPMATPILDINSTGTSSTQGPVIRWNKNGTWKWAWWMPADTENFGLYNYTAAGFALTFTPAGAATFTGDISMSKTSAQGYIRAYATDGVKKASLFHNGSDAYIAASSGIVGIVNDSLSFIQLNSGQHNVNGLLNVFSIAGNAGGRFWNSTQVNYTTVTADTTDGIIRSYSGNLNLIPTGGTVAVTGGITASGNATLTGSTATVAASTSLLRLTSAATGFEFRPAAGYIEQWTSGSDGQYNVFNSAGTKRIQLKFTGSGITEGGYITAYTKLFIDIASTAGVMVFGQSGDTSDPGLKRGGVGILSARYGDDSGDCAFTCAGITASGNVSYAKGLSTGTVTKSANYTTTADDYCVNVTANSIDITFETAVGCANREHEVINSGSGVVTLKTTSAQTISGNASGALTLAQWKSIRVKSDGANWLIMSQIT